MPSLTRRMLLKLSAGAASLLGLRSSQAIAQESSASRVDAWSATHDRVWLGENFWANPMENWRVADGAAECQSFGGNRNVHLLTHQLTNPQ